MGVWAITGASRGLGRALGEALVAAGHHVIALARSVDDTEAWSTATQGSGAAVVPLHLDLADGASITDAATHLLAHPLVAEHGLSGLVHNAGDVRPVGSMSDVDDAAWARSMQVNLVGVQQFTRSVWPAMLHGGCRVVTISSGASLRPIHGWSAYCVAKAGLDMWARMLAVEGADLGIEAVAVAPGVVDTAMQATIRGAGPEGFPSHADFVGLHHEGHLVPPDDVAERLLPVLLDGARFPSGQRFDVREL